jgi:hypothetical protein
MTFPVYIMPIRYFISEQMDSTSDFRYNQTKTLSKAARFYLGNAAFIGAAMLCVGLLIPSAIRIEMIWSIVQAFLVFAGAALVFVAVIAVPLTYVYEFYFEEKKQSVLNFKYALLLLYGISIPFTFIIICTIYSVAIEIKVGKNYIPSLAYKNGSYYHIQSAEHYNIIKRESKDYSFFYDFSTSPAIYDPSKSTYCNRLMESIGVKRIIEDDLYRYQSDENRKISVQALHMGYYQYGAMTSFYADILRDHFIRGLTFDVGDAFGCSYSDSKINYNFPIFCFIILIFKWTVSIFSVGILYLPFKKLFQLIGHIHWSGSKR